MTLVSFTLNHGVPILIGDVLFSNSIGDKRFNSPTFSKNYVEIIDQHNPRKPIYLKRKVYIINDHMCVGLGGSEVQMNSFLTFLNDTFPEKNITKAEFSSILKKYPPDEKIDRMFAIIICSPIDVQNNNERFKIAFFGKGWKEYRNENYELVIINGSGMEDYMKTLNLYHTFEPLDIQNINRIPQIELKALTTNLTLIGHHLAHELITQQRIKQVWGGGFELSYFSCGKFNLLTNVLICSVVFRYTNSSELIKLGISFMMKLEYQKNNLVMLVWNGALNQTQLYIVNPINNTSENFVPKIPKFHCSFIHCHIAIADEINRSYALGLTSLSDDVRIINIDNKEIS